MLDRLLERLGGRLLITPPSHETLIEARGYYRYAHALAERLIHDCPEDQVSVLVSGIVYDLVLHVSLKKK